MNIRVSSKALIAENGRLLLNRCRHENGQVYYDLPGGGQHPGESMEEALVREVAEETGLLVRPLRFAALAEEIYSSAQLREQFPDYCHRILHLFVAEPIGKSTAIHAEKDFGMEQSEWVALEDIAALPEILPKGLQEKIPDLLTTDTVIRLDTIRYENRQA